MIKTKSARNTKPRSIHDDGIGFAAPQFTRSCKDVSASQRLLCPLYQNHMSYLHEQLRISALATRKCTLLDFVLDLICSLSGTEYHR